MNSKTSQPPILRYKTESIHPNINFASEKTRQEKISFIFDKSIKKLPKTSKSLSNVKHLQMDLLLEKVDNITPKMCIEGAPLTFSLDPNSCTKQEWIVYPDDNKDPERYTLLELARQRLKSAIRSKRNVHLNNRKTFSDGPLEIRYYGEQHNMARMRPRIKNNMNFASNLLNSLQQEYRSDSSKLEASASLDRRKLILTLPDSTTIWHYPSGNIALLASRKSKLEKTLYYHIYDDSNASCMLASFLPKSRGICYYRDGNIGILYDTLGGKKFDQNGWIERIWAWPHSNLKLPSPIVFTLNQYIKLTCVSQNTINVTFSCNGEYIKLNLGYNQTESDSGNNSRHESPLTLPSLVIHTDKKKSCNINESFEVLAHKNLFEDIEQLKLQIMKLVNDWLNSYITTIKSKNSTVTSEMGVLLDNNNQKNSSPLFWEFSYNSNFDNLGKSLPPSRVQSRCSRLSGRTKIHIYNDVIDVYSKNFIPLSIAGTDVSLLSKDISIKNINPKKSVDGHPLLNKVQNNSKSVRKSICVRTIRNSILSKSLLSDNICSCNRKEKRKIPTITDVEYDLYITRLAPLNQITVICVYSSKIPHSLIAENVICTLHYNRNKYKSYPCLESASDIYRIFKYDLATAASSTTINTSGIPRLVERHKVEPGMFLMYWRAKLIFANFIFNGYGNDSKDFTNQIKHSILLGHDGIFLPDHFKFSPISNRNYIDRLLINSFEYTTGHYEESLQYHYPIDVLFNLDVQ